MTSTLCSDLRRLQHAFGLQAIGTWRVADREAALERRSAPSPRLCPIAADACSGEVAKVGMGERVVEIAHIVVLGTARVDPDEREPVVGDAVLAGDHLVVGDEEVGGTVDAGL